MPESVNVTVLFFAKARELVNATEASCTVPSADCTVERLLLEILSLFPALSPIHENVILAHNQEHKEKSDVLCLAAGDEIAIIPPISGG